MSSSVVIDEATGQQEAGSELSAWLPPGSRTILNRLRRLRVDRRLAYTAIADELAVKRENVQRQAHHYARLKARDGFNLPEDDQRVVMAEQQLTQARTEVAELALLERERAEASGNARNLVLACEATIAAAIEQQHDERFKWLRRGRMLQEVVVKPKLERGERPTDAIARLRKRLGEIDQELEKIPTLPIALSDAKATLKATIAKLAERGRPTVAPSGAVTWPTEHVKSAVFSTSPPPLPEDDRLGRFFASAMPDGVAGSSVPDGLAVVAWLLEDKLLAALEADLKDQPGAVTHTERQRRLEALEQEKLQCERCECQLVEQIIGDGGMAEYRPNTNPKAILRLA